MRCLDGDIYRELEESVATPHLFEIRLDVYATPADLMALRADCARLLIESGGPHRLTIASEETPELVEQWHIENPGHSPGDRAGHQLRIGGYTDRYAIARLREALVRLLCPQPEHPSGCPIPWSIMQLDDELEHEYGALRDEAA
jgi:hypothetical protein